MRKQLDSLITIVMNIKEMIDDDSSDENIAKSLTNYHQYMYVELEDVTGFANILDADSKKDYFYIEDNLENYGTYSVQFAKIYAMHTNNKKLLDALMNG